MPHTYASVNEFKDFLRDNGSADVGTTNDSQLLGILEGASRTVDGYCDRSAYGSGFGPRTGTNYYNDVGGSVLYLRDDLLTITSVTTYDQAGGSATTLTDETHFYKRRGHTYGQPPYRELEIHDNSSNSHWGAGTRGNVVVGTWGYQNETLTATPTVNEAVDTSETAIDITASTGLSIGQTWLIDSEQWYVTGLTSTLATVVRAANGTTAATHSSGAAIAYYRYPRDVVTATLLVAQRRWRARDAGLTASFGGEGMGVVAHQDSELSVLNRTVGHLRVYAAV